MSGAKGGEHVWHTVYPRPDEILSNAKLMRRELMHMASQHKFTHASAVLFLGLHACMPDHAVTHAHNPCKLSLHAQFRR